MFLKSENNNEVLVITNDTSLKINVFGKLFELIIVCALVVVVFVVFL